MILDETIVSYDLETIIPETLVYILGKTLLFKSENNHLVLSQSKRPKANNDKSESDALTRPYFPFCKLLTTTDGVRHRAY